ncbi:PRC-barrel domain-containing protein [Maribellus comscasis]|uniref:PRC-barrel domain-containing protein n=1 Tax=Maribellus comscasis TaxID=2681766 RepID=UPI001C2D1EBD|nr:PRC-barrel domain-containing protein [Maribellus comscasis]
MTPKVLSASSIKSTSVENNAGEDLGKIKDLMIDWENGSVAYAVVSFGGFLGLGEKLFAIPLESFKFESYDGKERAILNVTREQLEDAPVSTQITGRRMLTIPLWIQCMPTMDINLIPGDFHEHNYNNSLAH